MISVQKYKNLEEETKLETVRKARDHVQLNIDY